MEQPARAPDLADIEDGMDELAPLNPPKSIPAPGSAVYTQAPAVERTLTETTLYEPWRMRAESTPSPSDTDTSEFDASRPVIPNPNYKTVPGMELRQRLIMNTDQDNRALPLSLTAFDEYPITNNKSGLSRRRSPTSLLSTDQANSNARIGIAESETRIFEEAIADARRQLLTVRQREQSSRPLKVVSQDPERTPDPALCALFQKSADDELRIRRLNARDWLRVATWWLSKVLLHVFYKKSSHGLLIK